MNKTALVLYLDQLFYEEDIIACCSHFSLILFKFGTCTTHLNTAWLTSALYFNHITLITVVYLLHLLHINLPFHQKSSVLMNTNFTILTQIHRHL